MMKFFSEEKCRLMDLVAPWLYFGDDEKFHLKEDAPEEIKIAYKRYKEID